MSQITLKNIQTRKSITLDPNLKILRSTGREVFIQDSAVYFLLHQFFMLQASLLCFKNIGSIVRDKKSSCHMEGSPDSIIANKYVFKARSVLKNVMVEDFIIIVRRLGYKVSSKWLSIVEKKGTKKAKMLFSRKLLP